jgi:hypothetical protein
MGLADALQATKATIKGPTCTMCTLLKELPADDRKALDAALVDLSFTGAAISRALKAEGYNISDMTVNRHRKADCRR